MKLQLYIVLGAALAVSACAGRAPAPVAVTQAQDRYMDCAAINAEVQANNQKVIALSGEEGAKVAQNVVAGVAGLIIWPLWFAMDFQGAASKEVAALQARQQYLATLAEQRCGAVPPLPIQTVPTPATAAGAQSVAHASQTVAQPQQAPSPVPTLATAAGAQSVAPASQTFAQPQQAPSPVPTLGPSSPLDGLWLIDLRLGSSTQALGRCPETFSLQVNFVNRIAEGAWGRLRMTGDGDVSGSIMISNAMGGTIGQAINLIGRTERTTISGTATGPCIGSFTMSRRAPVPGLSVPGVPAYTPTPTSNPANPQERELSCINPDGSFLRTTAPSCPPPSTPLQL